MDGVGLGAVTAAGVCLLYYRRFAMRNFGGVTGDLVGWFVQVTEIIYPGRRIQIIPGLQECDFGTFEGNNFQELKDDPAYQAWLESGRMCAFPGG